MLVTLALAANLDNLGVGIAYGLKRTSITPTANLLIALLYYSCRSSSQKQSHFEILLQL